MHRSEPSRLQSLALQLSEKVNSLVDYNERVFETKQGGCIFLAVDNCNQQIFIFFVFSLFNLKCFVMILTGYFNRGGNQGNFRDRQNYGNRGQDWGRQRREREQRAY